MTKKQKKAEKNKVDQLMAQVNEMNRTPVRCMDKDGLDVVIPNDPRYKTAPYEQHIVLLPDRFKR